MPEFMPSTFGQQFQQGWDQAQQRRDRSRLAALYQQAATAPQEQRGSLLAQMAGIDPQAATFQQSMFDRQQRTADDQRQRQQNELVQVARLLTSAPEAYRPQVYEQFRQKMGGSFYGNALPEQYGPDVAQAADAILKAYDTSYGQSLAPRVVGDALVDATGNVLYRAPQEPEYQWSDSRGVWIPKPTGAAPQQGGDPFASLMTSVPGLRVTSRQRSPSRNAAVGGVPNSFHLTGQAIDIDTPSPEQLAQVRQWAAANGHEVITSYRDGHVHIEPRGNAPRSPSGLSAVTVEGIGPKIDDEGAYTTLTPQEVAALGLPQGTVAQRSPKGQVQIVNKPRDLPTGGQVIDNGDGTTTFIPAGKITEGERNAAGFYQRMVEANAEMKRLTDAGYQPGNLRDFMTTGRIATNFAASPQGQQYYQAAMNWVRANLRKESGAAIGKDEAAQEIRNYFPMPGDSKEVIAQKERNRLTVEKAMRTAAGGALPPPTGAPKQAPASGGWSIQRVD